MVLDVGKLGVTGKGSHTSPPKETTLMKTELKAKFLQHLLKKKEGDQGFTLIELLVVIIIIGVLSAIALPNFLNQTAKAKQSEAKQNVGVINRTQTAHRAENNAFASSFDTLAIGSLAGSTSAQTTNYTYNLSGGTDSASIIATARDTSLKAYSGGTTKYNNAQSQSVMTSVLCEATTPGTTTATPPTTGTTAPACPSSGYVTLD